LHPLRSIVFEKTKRAAFAKKVARLVDAIASLVPDLNSDWIRARPAIERNARRDFGSGLPSDAFPESAMGKPNVLIDPVWVRTIWCRSRGLDSHSSRPDR